jgi:hypothetical protein
LVYAGCAAHDFQFLHDLLEHTGITELVGNHLFPDVLRVLTAGHHRSLDRATQRNQVDHSELQATFDDGCVGNFDLVRDCG